MWKTKSRRDRVRSSSYDEILAHALTSNTSMQNYHPCSLCRSLWCRLRSHRDYTQRLLEQQLYTVHLQQGPNHGIHNEKANPFASHPVVMTAELERLYNQLFSQWNFEFHGPERHLFPFSRYRAILHVAPGDKAVFLGLLSMVATQLSITRHGKTDNLALALQLEVINAQRKALQKNGHATDARIATAQCILANSIHTEQIEDVGTNLATIKHMLHQRGGIQYLGMDGVLADNFMYIDHLGAIVRNVGPEFTVPRPYLTSPHAPRGRVVYRDLHQDGLLSDESACAATLFDVLLQIYDNAAKGIWEPSNASYFAYLANVVECQLAMANAKHHDTDTLDECVTLGLVIFNHTVFRNSRRLAPSVSLFERRFWRCFRSLRDQKFFIHHNLIDLEYYLACIGTITSLRRSSPFATQTTKVLAELRAIKTNNVHDYDQLCEIMEKYGWSRTVCFNLYRKIWDQSSEYTPVKKEMEEEIQIIQCQENT